VDFERERGRGDGALGCCCDREMSELAAVEVDRDPDWTTEQVRRYSPGALHVPAGRRWTMGNRHRQLRFRSQGITPHLCIRRAEPEPVTAWTGCCRHHGTSCTTMEVGRLASHPADSIPGRRSTADTVRTSLCPGCSESFNRNTGVRICRERRSSAPPGNLNKVLFDRRAELR
jgi:hypothetical protein